MVMSWVYTGILTTSFFFAIITGKGAELAAAVPAGAQSGISLAISISGSICLWTGVGALIERNGMTDKLSTLLSPFLKRVFSSTKKDPALAKDLSANICANFLGLGNAATPMGIKAVKRLKSQRDPTVATDEMCRLIVLNTASIQLIPANVAAIRTSLGCSAPFDILPAVWVTSLCSAGVGVTAAWLMSKVLRHG